MIAAITSCTNTSTPSVMVGAGILARNARERGLRSKPWVKTSLAPGSMVVTEYLDRAGLTAPLEELGFNLRGLRLHHLHRQLRVRSRRSRSPPPSAKTPTWRSSPCSPATATSKGASAPT